MNKGALLLTLTIATQPLAGQATWVVDQAAGPGHDFTTVQAAVAAAVNGDTIDVRPGTYTGLALDIDKGIRILGQPPVVFDFLAPIGSGSLAAVFVHDLAATQSFALRGIRLGDGGGLGTIAAVEVQRCAGFVALEELAGAVGQLGVDNAYSVLITDCSQVQVRSIFLRGGVLRFSNSAGVLAGSVLEGALFGPFGIDGGSDVTIEGTTITSGFPPFTVTAPVTVAASTLRVSRATIEARQFTGNPLACCDVTSASSIFVDPTATLIPANGAAPITGPAAVANQELVTQRTAATTSSLDVDLQGRSGAAFGTLLSFPVPGLPTPIGELWVDPLHHLVVQVGVLTTRQSTVSVPLLGLPTGFAVVTQSIVLDNSLTLSNPTFAVFP